MNRSTLKSLVETRHFSDENSLNEIVALAEAHPYCASFQVLKAIGARQFGRLEAKEQLNLASVYINDRAKLYTYTVRTKLLDHIASAEHSIKEFQKHKEKDENVGLNLDQNIESVQVKEDAGVVDEPHAHIAGNDSHGIQSAPLEARILIEAIGHLGELEVASSMSGLADQKVASADEVDQTKESSSTFDSTQYSSFTQWLLNKSGASAKPAAPSPDAEQLIIDKFIQESPQISPAKAAFFSPSQMGKLSLVEDESFVSETLAKIYERQGDFKKAARAYKQLALKYPEKRTYFAALEKAAESQLKN